VIVELHSHKRVLFVRVEIRRRLDSISHYFSQLLKKKSRKQTMLTHGYWNHAKTRLSSRMGFWAPSKTEHKDYKDALEIPASLSEFSTDFMLFLGGCGDLATCSNIHPKSFYRFKKLHSSRSLVEALFLYWRIFQKWSNSSWWHSTTSQQRLPRLSFLFRKQSLQPNSWKCPVNPQEYFTKVASAQNLVEKQG